MVPSPPHPLDAEGQVDAPPPTTPRVAVAPPPPTGAPLPPPTGSPVRAPAGAPSTPSGPPPPPARAVRGDGQARSTAATVVAATGALLLLAAAATFLAVSWDSLGVTARVAIVGAATAAAIVGGARLRSVLPAVGAVVYHLGALLLPVDALGLALQLDAGRGATWTAVGATAAVALPVAGVLGRSRLLAFAGVAGVPVLATGLGLLGVAPAPVIVALAAAVAVAVVRTSEPGHGDEPQVAGPAGADVVRAVRRSLAPLLAITAVAGPVVVAVASAIVVADGGTPLVAARIAGWIPTTWTAPAAAGALAVVTLAASAVLRRSARLAAVVPVAAALAIVGLVLAGDAPRLAELLPWPLLFLAVEVTALATRGDAILRRPTAAAASVVEVFAALAIPVALLGSLVGALSFGEATTLVADLEMAAVVGLGVVAWAVAAVRFPSRSAMHLAALGAAGLTLAAAAGYAAPTSGLAATVLLVTAAATVLAPADRLAGVVASGVTLLAGGAGMIAASVAAEAHLVGDRVGVVVAIVAAGVAVVIARRLAVHADAGDGSAAAVVLLPSLLAVGAIGWLGLDWAAGPVVAALATVVVGWACATLLDRFPVAGDVLRATVVAAVLLVAPAGGGTLPAASVMVPVTAVALGLLAFDLVRTRRERLALLAGPVAARLVAGAAWALSTSRPVTGVCLVVLAVAGVVVALREERWRAAGIVLGVVAGVPGIALLATSAEAIAAVTVIVGLVTVAAGLQRRAPVVAHVGGAITILGVWQLLALRDVTAVDVWLAAPALHLWVAALPARRAGRLSSWVADVPPMLLVAVPAVAERLSGGSGWHSAAAGLLGLVAVVGGGTGRHGGPLVVGVGVVATVTVVETIAVVAAVPTWVWLAVGGAVLVGAAALIERTGGRPVDTARRLRDVVVERFD